MPVSIIIPVLNDGAVLLPLLSALQPMRVQGGEVIVVDGGSDDPARELIEPLVDRFLQSPRGRAQQMNTGAEVASGDVLWFLHADSVLPDEAVEPITSVLAETDRRWGRFDVRLTGRAGIFRIIEWMMNRRSCVTGIATGDQGIFLQTALFQEVGGFPAIPIMEDIAFSKTLKRAAGRPCCLHHVITTSSRRWEAHGVLRTIWLMWRLRFAYFLGVSPQRLIQRYTACSSPAQES